MSNRRRFFLSGAAAIALCSAPSLYGADGAALYKSKICHSCHGETPDKPILPVYPKLSGQNVPYLVQQMKDIRDGKRNNGLSVAMKAVVGSVTDEEFQAIADWLGKQ